MRPEVKHRLKVAYEDLKPVNPRLVYGSISGFGQDGPYGKRAGVDQIAQGMGGLMSITGEPGRGPMRVGIAVNDMAAGTLLALGIMVALFERERTGEGRWVHTSLLETQLFLLDFQASRWLMAGEVPGQTGNDHPTIAPSSAYRTADGWINIAASSPAHWKRFCQAMGRQDWLENVEWRSSGRRSRGRADINAAIAEETLRQSSAHRVALAGGRRESLAGRSTVSTRPSPTRRSSIWASPRRSPIRGSGRRSMVASPLNLVGVEKSIRCAAQLKPENTDEVLESAGFSPAEIEAMYRARGRDLEDFCGRSCARIGYAETRAHAFAASRTGTRGRSTVEGSRFAA